ncbi:O-antigen ligase family protein [Vibrio sp. CK2-1]|uniref:O-antigen ligase family protein n=1 Tax=Vibrio sp. CK2-1 TaxID=2912249 RepID=UPI001F15C39C|nr:O-antigen ligase family protein [Vibrio sp. CK2-1]MCF7355400.1 O-antigen ligase family protein [Vibrio sp. CK2-1]
MNNLLKKSIFLPYLFMATGIFFTPHPDKKAVVFFILAILCSLIICKLKNIKENTTKPITVILLLLTFYSIFGYYYYPDGSRDVRALICLLAYFLIIPHKKIKTEHLVYFLFISGIISILNSSYYTYILQLKRETGFLNPNVYAGLTGAMAVASFSLLLAGHKKALCTSSFILLFSSTILTQSRTVTITALVISALLVLLSKRANRKHAIILLSVFSCIFILFSQQLETRYNVTKNELISLKKGNFNTSMGLRLEMWKYSPSVIKKSPLIGVGGEHREYLKQAYHKGEVSKELYKFNPPGYHNEIINRMVKNGLVGTLILLAFYITPIYYGFKQELDKKLLLWGVTGFYIISGITLSPLTQGATILLYGLLIIPFSYNSTSKTSITHKRENKL